MQKHEVIQKLEAMHAQEAEAIPSWMWTFLLGLISKSPALIAIVQADLAAHKSFMQIMQDVLAALSVPQASPFAP